MRIAVMGTGGIGGYFGGCLAAGNDVAFVARGAHLAAIRENGLRVTSTAEEFVVDPAEATDDPAALGEVDLVLFCVKLYDTDSAAAAIAPMVGDRTRVLTLQNGIDGVERLAARFGAARVFGGVAYIAAKIESPGVVSFLPGMERIVYGTLDGAADPVAQAFAEACAGARFGAEIAPDIHAALWTKMVLLATNAGISSVSRRPIRETYDDPESRAVAVAALREAEAVARARGVALPGDLVDRLTEMSLGFPADMNASMYHDLMAGNRLELDGLSGVIVRLGRELGVPTPVHATFYAMLRPYRDGRPG